MWALEMRRARSSVRGRGLRLSRIALKEGGWSSSSLRSDSREQDGSGRKEKQEGWGAQDVLARNGQSSERVEKSESGEVKAARVRPAQK